MMVEFDLRPRDSREFESWQVSKQPLSASQFWMLHFAVYLAGFVVWYHYPNALGVSGDWGFFVLPLGFVLVYGTVVFALGMAVRGRYRRAAGLTEGHHVMHFSESGVHHVGPVGIRRYAWSALLGVDVTVDYILLRFRDDGTISIPVSALKHLGPTYDEAFLAELAPLIQGGTSAP